MPTIEIYKQNLIDLVKKCTNQDVKVQILNILDGSINLSLSDDLNDINRGILELEFFESIYSQEKETVKYYIGYAYENKFRKLANGSSMKLAAARKALNTYNGLHPKNENIERSVKELQEYINKYKC